MATSPGGAGAQATGPTINPQALEKRMSHNPHQSTRFRPEEWENWMQWDGTQDHLSPKTPSEGSSPSLQTAGAASRGSTSPSEAESLPVLPLTPIYRIPSIDTGAKNPVISTDNGRRQPNKKRKTSTQMEVQESRTRQPKGQKISHNVIEKRYRTNLNDKIARLRDSVPVLKTAFEASQKSNKQDGDSRSDESADDDQAAGLGLKFNKATVLTKATEYIEQLEKANARLLSENGTLRRRVREDTNDVRAPKPLYFRADEATTTGTNLAPQLKVEVETSPPSPSSSEHVQGKIPVATEFRRLRAEASAQPSYAPSAPTPEPLSPSPTAPSTESLPATPAPATASTSGPELIDFDSVKGSIPVPDYITRNRVPISQQQHYAPPEDGTRYMDNDPFVLDDEEPRAWWPRNRASKLLLGSLAGLMIMEGFNANVETTKKAPPGRHPPHSKRGMSFLPDDFYTESRGFRAQIRQRIIDFAHSPRGRQALPILFFAGIIMSMIFLVFLYWNRCYPRGRRRANSMGSSPDRYDSTISASAAPTNKTHPIQLLPSPTSSVSQRFDDTRGDVGRKPSRGFIFEASSRLRACWHILTTGHNMASHDHRSRVNIPVPQVLVTGKHP